MPVRLFPATHPRRVRRNEKFPVRLKTRPSRSTPGHRYQAAALRAALLLHSRGARGTPPIFIMTVPGRSLALPAPPWERRFPPASVRATRKPMLLFRLPVVFLLRLAARRFSGWLFQEPPRNTRSRDDQASGRNRTALPERLPGAGAMYRHVPRARPRLARVE